MVFIWSLCCYAVLITALYSFCNHLAVERAVCFTNIVFLGPDLQCLLKINEDLRKVLIFQDAKTNV